jgi:ABC-type Fe3+ transport system substrate-binding protein
VQRLSAPLLGLGLAGMLLASACAPGAPSGPSAPSSGAAGGPTAAGPNQALVQALVARARQEGRLDANLRPGLGPAADDLANAFKRRFGLDIDVQLDALTLENQVFSQARATLQSGSPPAFDAMGGPDGRHIEMLEWGYETPVDNWQALLAEIHPLVGAGEVKPEEVSPTPFSGRAFLWSTVSKALLYNPNLIARTDLPRTRADLADPKYRGKLATSTFVEAWQFGTMYYPRDEWLRVADRVGQNSAAVLTFADSLNRILLGELTLTDSNEYYYWQAKAQDPQAPIGIHWFADYTAVGGVFNMVPKGARHPAAATLFSLWMTTPEAETILQRAVPYPNTAFGQTEMSKAMRKAVQESGSPVVRWYDNEKTLEALKWWATDEGRAYYTELVRALTQRR